METQSPALELKKLRGNNGSVFKDRVLHHLDYDSGREVECDNISRLGHNFGSLINLCLVLYYACKEGGWYTSRILVDAHGVFREAEQCVYINLIVLFIATTCPDSAAALHVDVH